MAAFCKATVPSVVEAVPTVTEAPLTAKVPVKFAALLIVWELMVLAVSMVLMPLRAPELIIRPLIVSVAVAPVIAPDSPIDVMPDNAPVDVKPKAVELIVSGALLLPKVIAVAVVLPIFKAVAVAVSNVGVSTLVLAMAVPDIFKWPVWAVPGVDPCNWI